MLGVVHGEVGWEPRIALSERSLLSATFVRLVVGRWLVVNLAWQLSVEIAVGVLLDRLQLEPFVILVLVFT